MSSMYVMASAIIRDPSRHDMETLSASLALCEGKQVDSLHKGLEMRN